MSRNSVSTPRIWDYGYLFTSALRRDLKKIFPLPGNILLDVGCGTQPHRDLLEQKDRRIITLDVQKDLPKLSICASGDHLPLKDKSCDIVTLFTSLQSVSDPALAVREAARVTKPGGHVLISDHQSWQAYSEIDRYRFTRSGLIHLAQIAGLSAVAIYQQGSFWTRFAVRINRAILPYSNSVFYPLTPLFYPVIIVMNILFGVINRLFLMSGEATAHVALFKKIRP